MSVEEIKTMKVQVRLDLDPVTGALAESLEVSDHAITT